MHLADMKMQEVGCRSFHPVVHLPEHYEVLDLSQKSKFRADASSDFTSNHHEYQIGKFDEVREGLYTQSIFHQESSPRCVHMGIDIGAPANTEVFSFDQGMIYAFGALKKRGDYGHSVVIEYVWRKRHPLSCGEMPIEYGQKYWALYGHLSATSLTLLSQHAPVDRGQCIGWLGAPEDNGGWPPHLHFQLSRVKPQAHDLPGVVTRAERTQALNTYPDPREVLGALY